MFSFILFIAYLAYISLGLPDPLLGSAWPVMHADLNVPVSFMGLLSMLIAMGTILSSVFADKLVGRLGTGKVTAISITLTAIAMLGFSLSSEFWQLCLWAVPYGLGAGAIDAALNNYVMLHFSAKHLSWLNCMWGVGTVVSPFVMGQVLTKGCNWNSGYIIIASIQIVIAFLVFISIPKWKKDSASEEKRKKDFTIKEILQTKGVPYLLLAFFCYCSMEATAGLWASSYLTEFKGVSKGMAATFGSFFYLGITLGRLLCGFVTEKMGDKKLIRIGLVILLAAIITVAVDMSLVSTLAAIFLIGFGLSPIYPSLMHATPEYVGKEKSLSVVGLELASAYIGINLMPTLFGFLSDHLWNGLYPYDLILFAVVIVFATERLNTLKNDP